MYVVDHGAPEVAADGVLLVGQVLDQIVGASLAPVALAANHAELILIADVEITSAGEGMVAINGVLGVIEVIGIVVDSEGVRGGHELLQEAGGNGVQTAFGDDVRGKRLTRDGAATQYGAGGIVESVILGAAVEREQVREVAADFSRRGDGEVSGGGVSVRESFIGEKEEELVLAVDDLGYPDGAAGSHSPEVLAVGRFLAAGCVGEKGRAGEVGNLVELRGRTVEFVRASLRGNLHRSAAEAAVGCIDIKGFDFHVYDGVDGRAERDARGSLTQCADIRDSIEQRSVGAGCRPEIGRASGRERV